MTFSLTGMVGRAVALPRHVGAGSHRGDAAGRGAIRRAPAVSSGSAKSPPASVRGAT